MKEKIKQGLEKAVLFGASVAAGLGLAGNAKAENPGHLQIYNNLNSNSQYVELMRADEFYPGATDGYDNGLDSDNSGQPNGNCDIYTNVVGNDLEVDIRSEDSTADYDIRLFFSGSLSSTQENWLDFSFPSGTAYEFGDQEMTFSSNALPYGSVVDVRNVIDNPANAGRLDLQDAVSGTTGEYATGTLTIGTRLLSDLDDDGFVNMKDYAILATDWQKPQAQYVGDITGPNGIPDGYVDSYDLARFSSDWLNTSTE